MQLRNTFYFLTALFLLCGYSTSVYAATVSPSPATGQKEVGEVFPVQLIVVSTSEAMNAVGATVSFPTDTLEVVSVSKLSTIVNLWIQEPAFSNRDGTVRFEGIVFDPGYKGSRGQILTIQFRAKKMGVADLTLSSGTILANDGSATEILTGMGSAKYTIVARPLEVVEVVAPPSIQVEEKHNVELKIETVTPVITSNTHPDEDVWYTDPEPVITWELPEGVTEARILIDQNSNSVPTDSFNPPILEKKLEELTKGVWYVHVQFKNAAGWGDIDHYRINIGAGAGTEEESINTSQDELCVSQTSNMDSKVVAFIFLMFIIAILLLLALLFQQKKKTKTLKQEINKEIYDADEGIVRAVNLLKKDIEEQVASLKAERPSKKLTKEERKLIKIVREDMSGLEKFLRRQIDDIEELFGQKEE